MSEGTQIILFVIACLAILAYHLWQAALRGDPIGDQAEAGTIAGLTVLRLVAGRGRTLVGVRLEVTEDTSVVACMNSAQARRLAGLLRNAASSRRGKPVKALR